MKTAMKRLLSFVLVAMMLVSVLPFQASATTTDTVIVTGNGNVNESPAYVYANLIADTSKHPAASAIVPDSTVYKVNDTVTTLEAITGETSGRAEAFTVSIVYTVYKTQAITYTITVDGEGMFDGSNEFAVGTQVTVSDLLSAANMSSDGYNMSVSPEGPYTPGQADPVAITLTSRQAPTSVILRYRPEGSNMDIHTESEFTESGAINLTAEHKVPNFTMGIAVRYNHKVYEVSGWTSNPDGTGTHLTKGMVLDANSPTTYYAQYTADNVQMNVVRFYAVKFVDNIAQEPELLTYSLDVGKGDYVNSVLTSSTAPQSLADEMAMRYGDLYDWASGTYYVNSKCTSPLATTATVGNGLNIYLKLVYTGENAVLVYPHLSITDSPRPIQLTGYAYGDVVELDDVITAVKKYYSVYSSNVHGLYDQTDWNQVKQLNKTINGQPSIVVDEETEVIHVLLKYASTSTPSDIPQTGDTILMAVTVFGVSASALAVLYFLNKKKQSV